MDLRVSLLTLPVIGDGKFGLKERNIPNKVLTVPNKLSMKDVNFWKDLYAPQVVKTSLVNVII